MARTVAIEVAIPFAPVHARQPGNRFWSERTLYLPSIAASVGVSFNSNSDIGTRIDLARGLGLDKHEQLRASFAPLPTSSALPILRSSQI